MIELKREELETINGGAIKWGILAGIGGFTTFIMGIIDGYINPQKCRK